MVQLWFAEVGVESVATAVKTSGPAVVGVPVTAPVAGFSDKPAGSTPCDRISVGRRAPPVATTNELYADAVLAEFTGQKTESAPPEPVVMGRPGRTIVLVCSVTAPVRANARPFNAAPVLRLIDAWARLGSVEDGVCSQSRGTAHLPEDIGGIRPVN